MKESLRQKKVASLVKETISPLLQSIRSDSDSNLISITRVNMTKDLHTAYIHISVYGTEDKDAILADINEKKGWLRKSVASRVKLKYNPKLIFSLDTTADLEERIEELLEDVRKKDKRSDHSNQREDFPE